MICPEGRWASRRRGLGCVDRLGVHPDTGGRGERLLVLGLFFGAALGLGCDDVPSVEDGEELRRDVPLVELDRREAWSRVELAEDRLSGHRPETIDCPDAAWQPELGGLEVQTGVCNYLALMQPSLVDLEVGDRVVVDLWHDALDAAAPSRGHVAVLIDDVVVGEAAVVIPSQAEVLRFDWSVDAPVPAGAEVSLHLHNHGFNSWSFVAITAQVVDSLE